MCHLNVDEGLCVDHLQHRHLAFRLVAVSAAQEKESLLYAGVQPGQLGKRWKDWNCSESYGRGLTTAGALNDDGPLDALDVLLGSVEDAKSSGNLRQPQIGAPT